MSILKNTIESFGCALQFMVVSIILQIVLYHFNIDFKDYIVLGVHVFLSIIIVVYYELHEDLVLKEEYKDFFFMCFTISCVVIVMYLFLELLCLQYLQYLSLLYPAYALSNLLLLLSSTLSFMIFDVLID